MKALVVLPSYNERENTLTLIDQLLALSPDTFVCVVDDKSPDGTDQLIAESLRNNPSIQKRVHLIVRAKKEGRGGAIRAGLSWGLASPENFESFVEMDCDFSHEPKSVPTGLHFLDQGYDVALGSRYPNGTIEGWPFSRRFFSRLANILARILIQRSVADFTNGFRFYTRKAADYMITKPQHHTGFIYLSETLSYFFKAGFKITSFPIYFLNRQRGVSNTSFKEVRNALVGIFMIAWRYHFEKS